MAAAPGPLEKIAAPLAPQRQTDVAKAAARRARNVAAPASILRAARQIALGDHGFLARNALPLVAAPRRHKALPDTPRVLA